MQQPPPDTTAVVLDLDGTLVDSVYQHVVAWVGAFRDAGLTVPGHRIHRLIGMGGDRLVAAATDEAVERAVGDLVRERHGERFADLLDLVAPTIGAEELVDQLARRRWPVTLATSGSPETSERLMDLIPSVREVITATATSEEAQASKPSGHVMQVSLDSVGATQVVAIGDTVWDVRAAQDIGAASVCLLTGGIDRTTLLDAGAAAVHETPRDLAHHLSLGHDLTEPSSAPA